MIVASVGNVLVWAVWMAAAFACLGSAVAVVSFSNAFYSALAEPIKKTPVADRDLYDTPIPYYKDHS